MAGWFDQNAPPQATGPMAPNNNGWTGPGPAPSDWRGPGGWGTLQPGSQTMDPNAGQARFYQPPGQQTIDPGQGVPNGGFTGGRRVGVTDPRVNGGINPGANLSTLQQPGFNPALFAPQDPYGMTLQDTIHTNAQARYRESLGLSGAPPADWQWNDQNPVYQRAVQQQQQQWGQQNPGIPYPGTPGNMGNQGGQSPSGQGGAAPTVNPHDPASVAAYVNYYANQPGANPSLRNDPNYWIGKITSGELGNDPGYYVSKFMTPEGAPAGQGGGGGSMGPFNGLPSDMTSDPSYQWRLNQGVSAVQHSAARNGTLLNGGTLKDLNNYAQGAASQEWAAQFGRGLALNQNNFNQNYSLAGLGLNATNYGINGANGVASNATSYGQTAQNNANGQSQNIANQGDINAGRTIADQNNLNNYYGNLLNLGRR